MSKYFINFYDNKYYLEEKDEIREITKKVFFKNIGILEKEVNNLKKSTQPQQITDYLLLKIPNFYNHQKGKMLPIDYKLVNIIKKLWEYQIKTYGINQKGSDGYGYIGFSKDTANGKNAFDIIVNLLGEKNIIIMKTNSQNEKYFQKKEKVKKENPNKIIISVIFNKKVNRYNIHITFKYSKIGWIHKKFGIEINKKKLKGGIIRKIPLVEFKAKQL